MAEPARCPWCLSHPLYIAYHDREWGVPERDDRALFEKLVLDGFQAGLSWWIILAKRAAFRRAFAGFVPEELARFSDARLEAIAGDPRIVRNRQKIWTARASAQAYVRMREAGTGFAAHLWQFVDGAPQQYRRRTLRDIPSESAASRAMAKDLKQRGFGFCGPTITYAFMQAVGMLNDHLVRCHRHAVLR